MTYAAIDTATDRLMLAVAVADDFAKLVSTTIGEYTIIDDGQDRWAASTDDYDEAVEDILESVLDGTMTPDEDEGFSPAYDRLCSTAGTIYTRLGDADVPDLCDALDCSDSEMLEIFEALSVEDEELPTAIAALISAGVKYSGSDAVNVAQGWLDEDVDAEDIAGWLDAGFWDARTVATIRDAGMTPDDATAAAERLSDAEVWPYTDGPIYSMCNGDTDTDVLITEHKRADS